MPKAKSEHRGITTRNGRWQAFYRSGGKKVSLGWFDTEAEALAFLTTWRTQLGLN